MSPAEMVKTMSAAERREMYDLLLADVENLDDQGLAMLQELERALDAGNGQVDPARVAELLPGADPEQAEGGEGSPQAARPDQDAPTGAAEVDGAHLLDDLRGTLLRFVVFPSDHAADAATLWLAASHAQDAWETATRFVVKSPLKRCGKTRLLDMVEHLAHNVLVAANVSPAALARSVTDRDPPTLVVDEQDAVFAKRHGERSETAEVLRGLLNAGHQRGRPYVRWDVATRTLERCPTFCMVALAAIGDLPDTIEDRAVIVSMRRRAPGERVTPFRRRRHVAELLQLRNRLHGWVAAHLKELAVAEPDLPVEDRAADTWEPLVAVADLAGGDWPKRARAACRAMTDAAAADTEGAASERLLADLRGVFGTAQTLWTVTILERLANLDEAPWGDWYGRPLNARDLAKLLRLYGVKSKNVREGGVGESLKGYAVADFTDAWRRYVPPPPQAPHPSQEAESAGQARGGNVTESRPASATSADQQRQHDVTDVADVTVGVRANGHVRCPACGEVAEFDPATDYGRRRLAEGHLACGVAWEPVS